jgi:O-antigen ligase
MTSHAETLGEYRRVLVFAAAGAVLALAGVALADRSPMLLPAVIAFGGAVGVVLHPFAGLLLVVFGSQTNGLIERVLPSSIESSALEAVALAVLAGVIASGFREPRERRLSLDSPVMRLAIVFFCLSVLSALFADNTTLAIEGLRKRLNLLVLFWLIVRLVDSERRFRAVILAVVLSTLVSAGLATFGFATGIQAVPTIDPDTGMVISSTRQAGAASSNPATSSRLMLAGTALAAVLAIRLRKRRALYAATALIGTAGIMVTFTRSTLLVMMIGAVWMLFKMRRHRHVVAIGVAAALVFSIVLALAPAYLWDRVGHLGSRGSDLTLDRRVGYHLIGLDLLGRNPVLGVGPQNFRWHYLDFEYRSMPGRFLEKRDLHNMYLSVPVETGLVGFVCFAAMLIVAVRGLMRVRRRGGEADLPAYAEAMEFSFTLLLIAAAFGAMETSKFLWIFLGLAVAIDRISREQEG